MHELVFCCANHTNDVAILDPGIPLDHHFTAFGANLGVEVVGAWRG